MRTISISMLFMLLVFFSARAQEWSAFSVPANPGSGMEWQLQDNVSDDFNYTMSEGNRPQRFNNKWYPRYHNNWSGPGKTIFNSAQAWADGDKLAIQGVRVPGTDQVYCGIITSQNRIKFPVYFEISGKIMNQKLANAFWLLSPDDTQEIDAMEGYGGGAGQQWFAERMHLSHHVFIRNPFTDWQPKDAGSWHRKQPAGAVWRSDYHRYGCYWRDPWHLEYYIDGVLVRTVSGKNAIDPQFHTNAVNPGNSSNDTRTGLNKAMDIIIDCENQTEWRPGPTDAELNNNSNIFWVDWVRVYKPVTASSGGGNTGGGNTGGGAGEFFIVNRATGKKIRLPNNNEGTPVQLVPASWSGPPTKWTKVNTNNGYFHLKNVLTNKYFRATADQENSPMIQTGTTGTNTQWREVPSNNGYVYLQNRATGDYIRPQNANNYSAIIQKPTSWSGSWTQWQLVSTSAKTANTKIDKSLFDFYPNPASETLNVKAGDGNFDVSIFDISGRRVKHLQLERHTTRAISISNLNSGVYVMRYSSDLRGTTTVKLVIK